MWEQQETETETETNQGNLLKGSASQPNRYHQQGPCQKPPHTQPLASPIPQLPEIIYSIELKLQSTQMCR